MADFENPIRFGFLPYALTIEFDQGRIAPIPSFKSVEKAVKKRLHRDGFLYPTMGKTISTDLNGKYLRTIPKSRRPTHRHPVPPSHDLYLNLARAEANVREESAGLVIHFWLSCIKRGFNSPIGVLMDESRYHVIKDWSLVRMKRENICHGPTVFGRNGPNQRRGAS